MKTSIVIKILFPFIFLANLAADAEEAVHLQKENLELLEKSISNYQRIAAGKMPKSVHSYLSRIEKPKSIYELDDRETIIWIDANIVRGRDQALSESIEKVLSDLALSGDKLHGDDVASILKDSFFSLWNKEDFSLENAIRDYAMYWREHSKPTVRFSPAAQIFFCKILQGFQLKQVAVVCAFC